MGWDFTKCATKKDIINYLLEDYTNKHISNKNIKHKYQT
jgi:hypothetical protein